ncbi:MAG TPA: DUF1328 domain-containing protein [Burkholderiales bacterium]|nr:DUF1328 domain-containing protein [Burkholderiales bacterium]
MLYWATVFLVVALLAAVFGLSDLAVMSKEMAWILFIVGIVLAIAALFTSRRAR